MQRYVLCFCLFVFSRIRDIYVATYSNWCLNTKFIIFSQLDAAEEISQNESTSTPATNTPLPKIRVGNNKAEMLRRRKERRDQFRKKTFGEDANEENPTDVENCATPNRRLSKTGLNKSADGEKEIPKLKVRFGRARDFNLLPKKKGKTRDDLFDDENEESELIFPISISFLHKNINNIFAQCR